MTTPYDDIINLPHHTSPRHRPMPMEARAAQFAPFAALTGYDAAIAESGRTTTPQLNLSADELLALSRRLAYALSRADHPTVAITYFLPDPRKRGGRYLTARGVVKKVEQCFNQLTLRDGTNIPLDSVIAITGAIFDDLDDAPAQ